MVITIDGPAGTGKSSVALSVAERLGFDFLDTGAMYRAIGVAALRREINLEDARELAFVAKHARIEYDWSKHPPGVLLNDEPVGHLLRGAEATRAASYVAVVPAIREMLVKQQQEIGRSHRDLVTEGRDQGTVVFPECRAEVLPRRHARRARPPARAPAPGAGRDRGLPGDPRPDRVARPARQEPQVRPAVRGNRRRGGGHDDADAGAGHRPHRGAGERRRGSSSRGRSVDEAAAPALEAGPGDRPGRHDRSCST